MPHAMTQIRTQDGECPAHVYYPEGNGPWPAALMYMDGIGMRRALEDMAARLSSSGYYVLLPNLFYRVGYNAEHGVRVFEDPVARQDLMTRIMPSASPANVMRDTEAFLAHFEAQPNVIHDKIGITGYCMGGRLAVYAAGTFGDRIAAAASYHGSRLAVDAPDSPHMLAPKMKARVYVGGAIEDAGFDDAQKQLLDDTLTAAGVDHKVETYNARHGWVPADTPVHDPVETERHWKTLLDLFGSTLPRRQPN
jgi:carboxymethylenebutenolidase